MCIHFSLFKGFHKASPDADVLNFITSRDPLFGARVITPNGPNHQPKYNPLPSEGSDNTYSPNSLSPLSQISPMSLHSLPPPPRTTPPPSAPLPPRPYTTFPPRSPAHQAEKSGGNMPPKVTTIWRPSSIAPWPQWPVKSVNSGFSEAIRKPSIEDIDRFVA